VTYARFLALFLGPLQVLGIVLVRPVFRVRHLLFLFGLSIVVVAWTSPWDNAAVAAGLWGFDPERISGIVIGLLPIEEYIFFLLQTWVTSLLLMRRVMR
jgi:lycopene cyclase domain-containing protein